MKSIKCPKCQLTNWSTTDSCKGCGAALPKLIARSNSHPALTPYLQGDTQNFAKYQPPPPDKSLPPMSLGVKMIILGCLVFGSFLYLAAHSTQRPIYHLILGASFIASGIVLCLREWFAVYVYLVGFAIATAFLFITEKINIAEDYRKPLSYLAIPTLIGLLLLNKMIKAKKSAVGGYAEQ